MSGGEVTIEDGVLADNSATSGGAVSVTGGSFVATHPLRAQRGNGGGGALHVSAEGRAVLSNGTLLLNNTAPTGSSVRLGAGGNLQYELPAPLGRWLLASNGVAELALPHYDDDLPFACAPGVYGDSLAHGRRVGPAARPRPPRGRTVPACAPYRSSAQRGRSVPPAPARQRLALQARLVEARA